MCVYYYIITYILRYLHPLSQGSPRNVFSQALVDGGTCAEPETVIIIIAEGFATIIIALSALTISVFPTIVTDLQLCAAAG